MVVRPLALAPPSETPRAQWRADRKPKEDEHTPGAGDFVAVLVPIITTPDVNVVERRAVRFDSDLHEVRARTSELETEDACLVRTTGA